MGVEIERKFRVRDQSWRSSVEGSRKIAQGYVSTDPDRTVRVRVDGERGVLTLKGRAEDLVRPEYEYQIPVSDARRMLEQFCEGRRVEKMRHEVQVGEHPWVVDEFSGANRGLVIAEVELTRADEPFEMPEWAGEEVSGQPRYYNARLAEKPYARW